MYTAFSKKTYEALKKEKLKFSVAVVVRDRPYDPTSSNQDWSSAYDYKELAKNSDFLSLMTYDEPNSNGPVASLPYVNRSLNFILTQAPAEKLSLGVPLYCWHWQDGRRIGSTTYNLAEKMYKKGSDRSRKFDEVYGAEYYKFRTGDIQNMIWCDSAKGIQAKQKIVDQKGLRGLSMWALGQGDKETWKVY
jgi:spore germination protein YaaH